MHEMKLRLAVEDEAEARRGIHPVSKLTLNQFILEGLELEDRQ